MSIYYGFDISQWNGSVSMSKAKANGKNFVLIRSSFGDVASYPNQKDWKFATNVANAKTANLNFGVYHYAYATTVSGMQKEAKGFVSLLNSIKPIPYFVALDIEESVQHNLPQAQLQSIIKAFIDVVEGAGYYCALYSYEALLSKLSSTFRNNYTIWCANISRNPSIPYGVHQYSFTGKVSGLSGAVDLNKTTIDYPTLIKNAGKNGYAKSSSAKPSPATTASTTKKSNETIAKEVIAGKWGNGASRKTKLTAAGYNYAAIQKIVDQKMSKKSNETIAKEVIAGKWGNGDARKKKLEAAGYNYAAIQKIVNSKF